MSFEGLLPITVDEALAIVESVMDYERFNEVQEIVFRQSWQGKSYQEMGQVTDYEPDYLKDVGSKLWKQLSTSFGEKVKKDNLPSVIKRYLKRNQVIVNRNQVIGVNFTGGSLSEANLSGAKLFTNLGDPHSCQSDSQIIIPKELNKNNKVYNWNGFDIRSEAALKIATTLEGTAILFSANYTVRVTTSEGRETLEFDFLIFHKGKSGILQIADRESDKKVKNDEIIKHNLSQEISTILYYEPTICIKDPARVVEDFLQVLTNS